MKKILFLIPLSISTSFAWGAHADAGFDLGAVPTPSSEAAADSLTAEAVPPAAAPVPCKARPLTKRSFAVDPHKAVLSCLARPVERSPRMTKLEADQQRYVGKPYTEETARRLRGIYDIVLGECTDEYGNKVVVIIGLSVNPFFLRDKKTDAELDDALKQINDELNNPGSLTAGTAA